MVLAPPPSGPWPSSAWRLDSPNSDPGIPQYRLAESERLHWLHYAYQSQWPGEEG